MYEKSDSIKNQKIGCSISKTKFSKVKLQKVEDDFFITKHHNSWFIEDPGFHKTVKKSDKIVLLASDREP